MESTRSLAEAKLDAYKPQKEDDKKKALLAAIIKHATGDS